MRITLIILTTLCTITFSVNAQKGKTSLSVGPSVGVPLNFATGYKTGFGGGIRGYFGVRPQGSLLLNVNLLSFPTKFDEGSAATLTSVKLGYKTNFNSSRLFLYGDGGLVIKSGNTGKNDTDPGIGGGIGYSIPTGEYGNIDIIPSFNIVFQNVINRSWLDFHLAYRFKL